MNQTAREIFMRIVAGQGPSLYVPDRPADTGPNAELDALVAFAVRALLPRASATPLRSRCQISSPATLGGFPQHRSPARCSASPRRCATSWVRNVVGIR